MARRRNIVAAALAYLHHAATTTKAFVSVASHRSPLVWNDGARDDSSSSSRLRMSFFGDLFKNAFANDEGLSTSDKTEGQLDYDGEDDDFVVNTGAGGRERRKRPQTEVQKRWLEAQERQNQQQQRATTTTSIAGAPVDLRPAKGAPLDPAALVGTEWILDLYLAGVPDRDPSNNLYGNRVNISSRDRGLGLGASVPEEPNVSVKMTFFENGVCRAEPSDFTTGADGEYRLSDDRRFVRFSVDALGFQRMVTTTGTISRVAWSEGEDTVSRTSSTYSIPEGVVYADASIGYGRPGELVMANSVRAPSGVLRVERRVGVLGAAVKMETCGRFSARMIVAAAVENRQ